MPVSRGSAPKLLRKRTRIEPRHVRLVDIAERLNLTKVSISKALRDHPDLPQTTRELVKRTAREMGYVPNYFAKSLLSSRSQVLGVVVPKIRHAFFAEAIAGIQERAAADGYEIVLGVSQEDPLVERRHIETFLSMRVDGLLVSVTQGKAQDDEIYRRVAQRGVPLVFFDRTIAGRGFGSVVMDDRAGAYEAISVAVRKGYKRIAHLAGYGHISIGRERRAGYEAALRAHRLPVRKAWIIEGGFDEIYGYEGFKALWAGKERPDAVFCASFPVAIGVIDALREVAPEAVGRIAIIFFGLRDMARFLAVPYICIAQPAAELGRQAVAAVIDAIQNPQAAPRVTRLPVRIITNEDQERPPYLAQAPADKPAAAARRGRGR